MLQKMTLVVSALAPSVHAPLTKARASGLEVLRCFRARTPMPLHGSPCPFARALTLGEGGFVSPLSFVPPLASTCLAWGPLHPPGWAPTRRCAQHTPFGGGGMPLRPPPCPSGSVD